MPVYRLDLHVHTPASSCFSGGPESYRGIIETAEKQRLDIIAVTDHHSIAGFEETSRLGKKKKILVLPGVELTCRWGGVNEVFILAVFDGECPAADIETLISRLGVPQNSRGNGGFVVPLSLDRTLGEIEQAGGLVISSRADKTPDRRKAIPELLRLGVRNFDVVHPGLAGEFFGAFRQYGEKRLRFFTFSDSHEAARTGIRFSEIELASAGYAQLVEKLAKNC